MSHNTPRRCRDGCPTQGSSVPKSTAWCVCVCVCTVHACEHGACRRRAACTHRYFSILPEALPAGVGAVCRAEEKKRPMKWPALLCLKPPLQQQRFPRSHSHLWFHFSLPARPGRKGSQQAGGDGDVNCKGRGRNLAAPGQSQHI